MLTLEKYVSSREADQISIGDELLVLNNHGLNPSKVVNVSSFSMQGKCHSKLTDFLSFSISAF